MSHDSSFASREALIEVRGKINRERKGEGGRVKKREGEGEGEIER